MDPEPVAVEEGELLKKDGGMRQLSQTLRGVLGEEAPAIVPASEEKKGVEEESSVTPLYVVGWLKRGPSGTIASSVTDAKETAASVLADVAKGARPSKADPAQRIPALRASTVIDWQRVKQIDSYEVSMGERSSPPRPRVKLSDLGEMVGLKKALREKAQAKKSILDEDEPTVGSS